jgi:serine/threonine-protein kinase
MNLHGLTDSVAGVTDIATKCRRCGATTRFGDGLCLNCTLREGLDADREASRESFEAILAEDEVHDTHWRVGNYEILEEIGRGGMGVIYRARQRHSRRIVALKRLVSYHADSPETLERFRREAEAAASLDHPNILPIYDVGQGEDGLPFFSMKYATGGSLQKPCPGLRNEPHECVRLVAKVARAVQYAHEHGVLHRDLKPGNILLDGRGEPFVSDFGLAKWLDTNTDLTRTLTIFGTPGYIAPEQAKGPSAKLTPTADVYSLGAILFNLFTGRPPFLGEHALAVIQQASEEPAPKLRSLVPALDRDLETICARCLEREPQARYRSANDLAVDLERWLEGRPITARRVVPPVRAWRWSKRNPQLAIATAVAVCFAVAAAFLFFSKDGPPSQPNLGSKLSATSTQVKTIAVLPFKMLKADTADEYLSIGLADTLITQIGRIPEILARPPRAVQKYAKSQTQDPLAAGRELRVEAILDGTVQRDGDKLRVTARLLRVGDGAVLWSGRFDETFTGVFAVQDSISQAVAKALIRNLSGADRELLTKRHTDNTEAFRAYLKGRYFWNKRSGPDLERAINYFRQAIDLDPTYALAYSGLADCYAVLCFYTNHPSDETFPKARALAEKALEIDNSLAEPHATLGQALQSYYWDWAGAEKEYKRALELNPNYATAHQWYGWYLLWAGRHEASVQEMKRALELDPISADIHVDVATALLATHQPDEAMKYLQEALEMDPNFIEAHWNLGLAYQQKRQFDQSITELERARELSHDRADVLSELGNAYVLAGNPAKAMDIAAKLEVMVKQSKASPYYLAMVLAALGEKDKALAALEAAASQGRFSVLIWLKANPIFDSLHNEPRFQKILASIGLTP